MRFRKPVVFAMVVAQFLATLCPVILEHCVQRDSGKASLKFTWTLCECCVPNGDGQDSVKPCACCESPSKANRHTDDLTSNRILSECPICFDLPILANPTTLNDQGVSKAAVKNLSNDGIAAAPFYAQAQLIASTQVRTSPVGVLGSCALHIESIVLRC